MDPVLPSVTMIHHPLHGPYSLAVIAVTLYVRTFAEFLDQIALIKRRIERHEQN